MRYRIKDSKKGLVVSVEDGDTVLVSIPAKDMKQARALRDKAHKHGWQALSE
jgi:hypothetical protein